MTREEFAVLAKAMKAVYTDPKFLPDQDALNTWFALLRDLDYKAAALALQKYMLTQRFPPTVADIRNGVNALVNPGQLTGMEAWSLVLHALRNSGYNYETEFAALPEAVQRAVGSAQELHNMAIDEDFREDVARSNFLRAYDATSRQEMTESTLPPSFRAMVEETAARLAPSGQVAKV